MSKRMILNPDRKVVDAIINRIYTLNGKCPCQPITSDNDTMCPCEDFILSDNCHCSLFVDMNTTIVE